MPVCILAGIVLVFFYKTVFLGKIPFPGDLLLSHYNPWRHESYAGYAEGGVPSKDQYFDVIRELYPWKTLVIDELKHGGIPLWNPYNFSGTPLLANYQSQVLYPLSIFYYIFPQITAWTILVILQAVLGCVFVYLFTKEIGLSAPAAIISAILFNFSAFANTWIEFNTVWHTIIWLPLMMYFVERAIKQKRLYFWQKAGFIIALFSSITAGHPQDFIYSFLFLAVYTAFRLASDSTLTVKEKLSFIIHHLLLAVIAFCLAAPQLLPTIELFKNSARVTHDYQQIVKHMLVQWWQLPLIAIQELYGNPATKSNQIDDYVGKTLSVGFTGLMLSLFALRKSINKSWHAKFFAGLATFILIIMVNSPVTKILYRFPIPILSTGAPNRILFLLAFAVAILAGYGFDVIRKTNKTPVKPIIGLTLFIGTIYILTRFHIIPPQLVNTTQSTAVMKRALTISLCFFAAGTAIIFISRKKKILLLAFIPLCLVELLYGFLKFNPFVPKLFVFPENKLFTYLSKQSGIDRYWGYGTAAIEANFATQWRLYSPDGTDPLNLKWYNRFIQASQDGNLPLLFNRTTRSDALLAPGYGETDLPDNAYRLRVMDVLGVKYVISRTENPASPDTFSDKRFKEIQRIDNWIIYQNLLAAPRFFLTDDVRPYASDTEFEKNFFSDTFEPNRTVLLEMNDYLAIPKITLGKASATLISYEPSKVTISLSSDRPQFLFLSDTFDAGWTATINRKKTTIYKSNYAFRGIVVPAGKSTIKFTYQPDSFLYGLYISVAMTVGLMILSAYHLIKKRL